MRTLGSVTALTVACVLMASGAAAALNDRVLHGGDSPVGTAESFLPADEPWTAPLPAVDGSTPGTSPEEGLEPVGEPSGHASGDDRGETGAPGATGAAASASESESEDPVESARPTETSSSRVSTQSRASANVGSRTPSSAGGGGHDDPTSASDTHDSTGPSGPDPAPTERDD